MEEFKITESGIVFVPRYVKTELDYNYGELVSHEAFNEHINLNTTQGDYNTEILRLLFNETDPSATLHIKYLDNIIEQEVNRINGSIDELQGYADSVQTAVDTAAQASDAVTKLIIGDTSVKYADSITGINATGINKYYGTDETGTPGFYNVPNPESLYAEPISSGAVEIDGIYYTPRVASVEEEMLSEAVQAKLNRSSITDYNYLDNTPTLAGVPLKGDVLLSDIGAQPVGNYLTEIPEEYVTNSELNTAIAPFLTTSVAASTYALASTVNTLSNSVSTVQTTANKAAVVCVGTFSGTPKTGDLLITV